MWGKGISSGEKGNNRFILCRAPTLAPLLPKPGCGTRNWESSGGCVIRNTRDSPVLSPICLALNIPADEVVSMTS